MNTTKRRDINKAKQNGKDSKVSVDLKLDSTTQLTKSFSKQNNKKNQGSLSLIIAIISIIIAVLLSIDHDHHDVRNDDVIETVSSVVEEDYETNLNKNDDTIMTTSTSSIPKLIVKDTIMLGNDSYEVLEVLEHDSNAFTQGLTYHNGLLYEGTGLHGQSEIKVYHPSTPSKILKQKSLPSDFFGEGITYYKDKNGNDRIIQITWQEKRAFVYDADTLELKHQFEFITSTGEGWGISFIERDCEFVVSDGSHNLMFWDCETFEEKRRVEVKFYQNKIGKEVKLLNELEVIKITDDSIFGGSGGEYAILANVWFQNVILHIDPSNGFVEKIYFFNTLHKTNREYGEDVFNGIAISEEDNHSILYVTGKKWRSMYKVKLNS